MLCLSRVSGTHNALKMDNGQRFVVVGRKGERELGGVRTNRVSVLDRAAALGCCSVAGHVAKHFYICLLFVVCVGGGIKSGQAGERQPRSRPCLLYTYPSPRDATLSRMPSSA